MDVDTLALHCLESLLPYFKPSRSLGTSLAEDAPTNLKVTWGTLLTKFTDDPQAASVARALIAQPNSLEAQNIFREKLRKILEYDLALLAQLEASLTANAVATAPVRANPLIRLEPEDTGAYPRHMPHRRRCEG